MSSQPPSSPSNNERDLPPVIGLKLARSRGELMVTASFSRDGTNLPNNPDGLEFVTRFDTESMEEVPLKDFGVEPNATDTVRSDARLFQLFRAYFDHARAILTQQSSDLEDAKSQGVDDQGWSAFSKREGEMNVTDVQMMKALREAYLRKRSNMKSHVRTFLPLLHSTRDALQNDGNLSSKPPALSIGRTSDMTPNESRQETIRAALTEAIADRHSALAGLYVQKVDSVCWGKKSDNDRTLWWRDALREAARCQQKVVALSKQLNTRPVGESSTLVADTTKQIGSVSVYFIKNQSRPQESSYVCVFNGEKPPLGAIHPETIATLENLVHHYHAVCSAVDLTQAAVHGMDKWIKEEFDFDPLKILSSLDDYIDLVDHLESDFNTFAESALKCDWDALQKEYESRLSQASIDETGSQKAQRPESETERPGEALKSVAGDDTHIPNPKDVREYLTEYTDALKLMFPSKKPFTISSRHARETQMRSTLSKLVHGQSKMTGIFDRTKVDESSAMQGGA